MPERHATRGAQTRAAEKRELQYVPPNQLDAPKAKPGVVHRWVRVSLMGVDDDKNLSLRRREGWETVREEEHPEFIGPVHSEGRFSGVIGVGDLILMKWTEEGLAAKRRYVDSKTDRLQSALDSSLFREQDPRMPITVDRKSRVSTGGGLQFDE